MLTEDIKLYEALTEKLGSESAQRIVQAIQWQREMIQQQASQPVPSRQEVENKLMKLKMEMVAIFVGGLMLIFWIMMLGLATVT